MSESHKCCYVNVEKVEPKVGSDLGTFLVPVREYTPGNVGNFRNIMNMNFLAEIMYIYV